MSINQLLQSGQPLKWLFYGDSITQGALHTYGHRDYTELFEERVRWEMQRTMDVVINTAISGHTTQNLLEGFEWRVRQFAPHVVFVMIGANDCHRDGMSEDIFAADLESLGRQIHALGALPVLQTTNRVVPGRNESYEKLLAGYMEVVREVAARNEWLLVDHARYWADEGAKAKIGCEAWLDDYLHPNAYGHRVFAECLLKTLGLFDPEAATGRLFRP